MPLERAQSRYTARPFVPITTAPHWSCRYVGIFFWGRSRMLAMGGFMPSPFRRSAFQRYVYMPSTTARLPCHRRDDRSCYPLLVTVDLGRTPSGKSSGGTNPSACRCHSSVNHDGGSAARSHSGHCASHALSISGAGQ